MNSRNHRGPDVRFVAISAAAGALLLLASHSCANAQGKSPLDQIGTLAVGSNCASVNWGSDGGRAPSAYILGMALLFARAVCQADRSDVRIVSAARGTPGTSSERTDALTWYDTKFRELGMPNVKDGVETLRHTYVLMIGLGMRETSGKYCVGRDRSANFDSADTAEAGLFQTSWGAHKSNRTLPELFER
jgi:hypothetical protein